MPDKRRGDDWDYDVKDGNFKVLVIGIVTALIASALLLVTCAFGRDLDGRYAAQDPKLHEWFEGLRSGKGPCCSDADGSAVSDADWRTKDRRYQVRLDVSRVAPKVDMQWIDVPEDAVITEPNRAGKTMVWPIYGYMGVSIRCFMPGSMG